MRQEPVHGIGPNAIQFWTLVLVNAFVGGMVGMERSILPDIAETDFGITSSTAVLTFIIAFGITKAISNYFAGRLANRWGRKNLLVLGWLFAIPVPFMLMYAESWNVIIAANLLLGINQGLAWSSTVVMKIDLAGEKQRGLAMGLNEFAGYLAVGLCAYLSAVIADDYGLRPYPFYLGVGLMIAGLLLSIFVVRDTRGHVGVEEKRSAEKMVRNVFWHTTYRDPTLGAVTQAGLINNLNDGMIWGLLPLLLLNQSFTTEQIGIVTATYPAVWGLGQLFTGRLADLVSNKKILFWGMLIQGLAIVALAGTDSMFMYVSLAVLLGFGTALVYPTFFVVIAKRTTPFQRPESIGAFRLWRDLGYAIGALLSGVIADLYGLQAAVVAIGVLTIGSALIIQIRMHKV